MDNCEPLKGKTSDRAKETSNLHDLYSVAIFHHEEGIVDHLTRAYTLHLSVIPFKL